MRTFHLERSNVVEEKSSKKTTVLSAVPRRFAEASSAVRGQVATTVAPATTTAAKASFMVEAVAAMFGTPLAGGRKYFKETAERNAGTGKNLKYLVPWGVEVFGPVPALP